jgi:hypothetical protein
MNPVWSLIARTEGIRYTRARTHQSSQPLN